jgi:hypothetical protein
MAQYSDTDIDQAALMSKLSGVPAQVQADVFVWNGVLVDRATAVVSLLKVYSQVPVSTSAKNQLYNKYIQKFNHEPRSLSVTDDNSEIWFYKLCKKIQGEVKTRTSEEVKQILIGLHR